jgi:hypothetical protein
VKYEIYFLKMSATLDIKGSLSDLQINVIDCISMHFTDIYFNFLYTQAVALREKKPEVQSITDGYKLMIKTYGDAIGRPEFIRDSLQGIHKRFREVISVSIISSYEDCVNNILGVFLPEQEYNDIIKDHAFRNQLVGNIITRIANSTKITVMQKFLVRIIDERTRRTVEEIQDHISDEITQIAYDMHLEVKNQYSSSHERIDRVVMAKLHEECKKAMIEKMEMTKKMIALETIIRNKMAKISELEEHIAQLNQKLESKQSVLPPVGQTSTLFLPLEPIQEQPQSQQIYQQQPQPQQIYQQQQEQQEPQQEPKPERKRRDLSGLVSPPASPTRSVARSASVRYDEETGASNIINRNVENVNPSLFA